MRVAVVELVRVRRAQRLDRAAAVRGLRPETAHRSTAKRGLNFRGSMASRIDVSIEHKHAPPDPGARRSTPTPARSATRTTARTSWSRTCASAPSAAITSGRRAASGSSSCSIRAASSRRPRSYARPIRSSFFDLRSYKERIAEAELKTGLGDAMLMGQGKIEDNDCQLTVMDFSLHGRARWEASSARSSRAPASGRSSATFRSSR